MKNYKISILILLSIYSLFGQIIISGIVTNDDGKILPGANIVLKGTSLGTVSDQEGQYKLDIPEKETKFSLIKLKGEKAFLFLISFL